MLNTLKIENSQITDVILYRNGAVITRKAKVELSAGDSKLILPNLSSSIISSSVNILFSGDIRVNSVKIESNYLNNILETEEIKMLKLSESELIKKINKLNSSAAVILEEENYLKNASPKELKVAEFKELLTFFTERMSALSLKKLTLSSEIKDLKSELEKVQSEIKKSSAAERKYTSEIVCEVTSSKKTCEEVTYTYNTGDAGFTPSYDIRALSSSSATEVTLKANVFQQTNENWHNINLTISTSTPNVSTAKPILNTWFLGFYNPTPFKARGMMRCAMPLSMENSNAPDALMMDEDCEAAPAPVMNNASVTDGQAGVEFTLKEKVSIASAEEKFVDINKHSLASTLKHFAINKIDKNVYLMAKLSNWEELNLISGNANVYLDNKFVGITKLDRNNVSETLDVSLGRDDGIIISRELITDFKGKTTFGSNSKAQRCFSINIKNLKKLPIELELYDQIPVSTDKSIVIDPIELDGAELNKNKGELKWNISLAPSKETTKTVKYTVTYPQDKQVILD